MSRNKIKKDPYLSIEKEPQSVGDDYDDDDTAYTAYKLLTQPHMQPIQCVGVPQEQQRRRRRRRVLSDEPPPSTSKQKPNQP